MRAAVVVAMIGLIAATWAFTPDDTYISLRYANAEHAAEFNRGERYEGYVCPLWLLMLRGSGEGFAKAVSAVAAAAAVIAWPVLAAIPWMPMHGASGMETALAMLLAGLAVVWYREWEFKLSAVCVLLLALCRPEMALLSPLLLARRAARATALLWFFLPFAAYWGLRWAYFGSFLPAPITAKLHGAPAFNYGYRYAMPLLAAGAAWLQIPARRAAVLVLLMLPLTLRATQKAIDYHEGLERGYGAIASRVVREGVESISIDTPGLVAYKTGVRVVDPNGIAASSAGEAQMRVRILRSPAKGAYYVNDNYWLIVDEKVGARE